MRQERNVEHHHDRVDYIVGAELRLEDILKPSETAPLLKGLVAQEIDGAAITDEKGRCLWAEGAAKDFKELPQTVLHTMKSGCYVDKDWRISPLHHEGETIGFLVIVAPGSAGDLYVASLTEMASISLHIVMQNTIKRMLTTELHTTVVQRSYEELLEINKQLTISEKNYRDLAQTLEQKVEERTAELKRAYTRLLQQEKMASIGHLAAGIAHEINNPTGFIYSNLNTLGKYMDNVLEMLCFYRERAGRAGGLDEDELYKKLKIDFIRNDARDLISQSMDGAERIKKIVATLKDFSHIDESANRAININAELDTTIDVLSHEIKERAANVIRDYGKVVDFNGNAGLVNQVFFNILLNALQSRESNVVITVRTRQEGDTLVISIADNGKGIPPEIQNRIFDPFFTTRDVGKGTGMGLTITYDIVTTYGGTIEVKSETGKGSQFTIKLPLREKTDAAIC